MELALFLIPTCLLGMFHGLNFLSLLFTFSSVSNFRNDSLLFCPSSFVLGALDPVLVASLVKPIGEKGSLQQLATVVLWFVYVLLMVITAAAWRISGLTMLFLFLVTSVAHFGEGDLSVGYAEYDCEEESLPSKRKQRNCTFQCIEGVARGGMFFLAINRHANVCQDIFQIIIGGSHAEADAQLLMSWLWAGRVIHFIAMIITVSVHSTRVAKSMSQSSLVTLIEMGTIAVLFCRAPPLMAFAVYFNAFHALRHMLRVVAHTNRPSSCGDNTTQQNPRPLNPTRRGEIKSGEGKSEGQLEREQFQAHLKTGGKFTAMALLLLALMYQCVAPPYLEIEPAGRWESMHSSLQERGVRDGVLRVVFMALSIVTSPHMLLVSISMDDQLPALFHSFVLRLYYSRAYALVATSAEQPSGNERIPSGNFNLPPKSQYTREV